MTNATRRKPGRPRLQAEPCTLCIGVPLTTEDWDKLAKITARYAKRQGRKLSKQEVIRQMIRKDLDNSNE